METNNYDGTPGKSASNLTHIIKEVGFPIVCVVGCAWFIYTTTQQYRTDTIQREERMYKQLEGFQQTLTNFDKTLSSIDTRLQFLEGLKKK